MLRAEMEQVANEILTYRCPRYEHLPNIPLYSDQVIDSLKQYTAPFYSDSSEQAITPTMINNYVKQHREDIVTHLIRTQKIRAVGGSKRGMTEVGDFKGHDGRCKNRDQHINQQDQQTDFLTDGQSL